MRDFMGMGRVKTKGKPQGTNKSQYELVISRRSELLVAVSEMLPHSIIKREKLLEMQQALEQKRDQSPGWGKLAAAGVDEIRRLYWEESQSFTTIAEQFNVTPRAVQAYMKRHGIERRSRGEAIAKAMATRRDSERWKERNRKLSERRRAMWQDPTYREAAIFKFRQMQPQRIATLKARREARLNT